MGEAGHWLRPGQLDLADTVLGALHPRRSSVQVGQELAAIPGAARSGRRRDRSSAVLAHTPDIAMACAAGGPPTRQPARRRPRARLGSLPRAIPDQEGVGTLGVSHPHIFGPSPLPSSSYPLKSRKRPLLKLRFRAWISAEAAEQRPPSPVVSDLNRLSEGLQSSPTDRNRSRLSPWRFDG